MTRTISETPSNLSLAPLKKLNKRKQRKFDIITELSPSPMTKQELTLILEKLCTMPIKERTVKEMTEFLYPAVKDTILTVGDAWDEATLSDWYQSSIDEKTPPIWTDRHLEELMHDFYVIPKPHSEEPFV